jgi:hypothetical protein
MDTKNFVISLTSGVHLNLGGIYVKEKETGAWMSLKGPTTGTHFYFHHSNIFF